jgi:hypothetical protein
LPLEYKSHSNFDIVLLCELCHSNYEIEASKYWYSIISKLYEDDFKNIKIMKNIDKHITTLKVNKNIPEDRKLQILHNLQHYYNNPNITIDSLNTLKKVEKYEELDYTELFEHFGGCFKFIISCRQHFLKTAKPKFISPDWVNSIFKKETYLNKV